MHAKSSIQSFYKHVESDANVVDGLLREAEADELAQGWDAFRADVPLQHREASCRSKRSQSFWDCLKEKARARTRRSLSCSVRSQQWLCALPLYACAQAHVIGVRACVRHVHWSAEVSIWSSVACTQYKSSLRRSNYMCGLSSSQLEPRLYCQVEEKRRLRSFQ